MLERNVDQFPQLNQFGAMAWEFRWENKVQQTIANQFNSARVLNVRQTLFKNKQNFLFFWSTIYYTVLNYSLWQTIYNK